MTTKILCLLLVTAFYATIQAQEPVECSEDVHCDQGYFCGRRNKCYKCLSCDIFNRKPAATPVECVYTVYHCGGCLSGHKLINDECVPAYGEFWSWWNLAIALAVVAATIIIASFGIYASCVWCRRPCCRRNNLNEPPVRTLAADFVVQYTTNTTLEPSLATSPEPTTSTTSKPPTSPATITSSEGKTEEGETLTGAIGIIYKSDDSSSEGRTSRSKSLPPSGASSDDRTEVTTGNELITNDQLDYDASHIPLLISHHDDTPGRAHDDSGTADNDDVQLVSIIVEDNIEEQFLLQPNIIQLTNVPPARITRHDNGNDSGQSEAPPRNDSRHGQTPSFIINVVQNTNRIHQQNII